MCQKSILVVLQEMQRPMNISKYCAILAVSFLVFSSCKKEGCTDPTATNYDEKAKSGGECTYAVAAGDSDPTVEFIKPETSVEVTRKLALEVKLSDNKELETATFTITADAFSGGAYSVTTRALNGKEEIVKLDIELPELNMTGKHYLLVTCNDDDGNVTTEGLDFELTDKTKPEITESSCSKEVELAVDDIEFVLEFNDEGGLKDAIIEFWAYKYLGQDPNTFEPYTTTEMVKIADITKDYTLTGFSPQKIEESFGSSQGDAFYGDFELRYTINDLNKNMVEGVFKGKITP